MAPAAVATFSTRPKGERVSRRSAWVFLAAFVATASGRWSAGASSVTALVSPFPPRPAGWITKDGRQGLDGRSIHVKGLDPWCGDTHPEAVRPEAEAHGA